MNRKLSRKQQAAVVVGTVAVAAVAGTGVAMATGDDDASERPIEGAALEKATQAALAETGEGRVTGTEVDDEDSKYEVEVTLDDGSQVDVQLDERFEVVSRAADHEDRAGDGGE